MRHEESHNAWDLRVSKGANVTAVIAIVVVCVSALVVAPRAVNEQNDAKAHREFTQASSRLEKGGMLKALDAELRDLAASVEPSVVYVSATMPMGGGLGTMAASGSGWVWDSLGHIVTNAHVVDGALDVQVQDWKGQLFDAEVVGVDLHADIAVLKAKSASWIATKRQSGRPAQGQMVFAFGSPFDFRFSMSSGIVSGLGRVSGLEGMELENFVQVDAAINPGNSGGPLMDAEGRVIGMNTAMATGQGNQVGQGSFSGIGLAIPIEIIESVVPQLIETGEVEKGYLGISVQPVASLSPMQMRDQRFGATFRAVAEQYHDADGALINLVENDSPAAAAGLRPGDIILALDDEDVREADLIPALIASHRPREEITLRYWRAGVNGGQGDEYEVAIKLARRAVDLNADNITKDLRAIGAMELATATVQIGENKVRGVSVAQSREDSLVAKSIPEGAIIVAANGLPVRNVEELIVRLQRIRQQVRRSIAIPVPLKFLCADGREGSVEVLLR